MNKDKLVSILELDDFTPYYRLANAIKEKHYGKDIYIRAIVEFSNHCKMDCKYCGLNCHNKKIERFRMSPREIVETGIKAHEAGYKTLVMQSGEDAFYTAKILGEVVKAIKKTGIAITLSCGEMSFEDYEYLKSCGADRYLLKHECSDNDIYSYLHTTSTFENRINCLKNLKTLGYEVGSGFMIGLPNQTLQTVANDILLLSEIECDMAGIGPFIPHPETDLKDLKSGSTELTKRAVALTRILMGKINLPATTSLGVVNNKDKNDIFSCGANVIMRKVTPEPYKSLYEIYPSNLKETNIIEERKELEAQIKALGKVPV
ncbi:MAG: [FeFe] hydrogenase H-cluster radical SAM maturase HydE [Clostridia bacterium]